MCFFFSRDRSYLSVKIFFFLVTKLIKICIWKIQNKNCLVLHPLLISLNSELKTGYLDDVSLGESWRVVLKDLLHFREEAEKLGLSLNEQKCEVKVFRSNKHDIESTFLHQFPINQCVPAQETTLLGAGLGQSAVRNELIDSLGKLKTLISRTYKLPAQTAFFLIKNFFVPKLMYVLRSTTVICFSK